MFKRHSFWVKAGLVSLAMLGAIDIAATAPAQSATSDETARSVRRALDRLPHYGVFDHLDFTVVRGSVTLVGST